MNQIIFPRFFEFFASSTIQTASQRIVTTWTWYVVRSAGFVAAGLLVLLMISGIGLVTGLTFRVFEPTKAWIVHRTLALALCGAIVVHVVFIVLDHYVKFSVTQVLIPFTSNYRITKMWGVSIGSLFVALGIFAMYGVTIIVLSSLNWIDTKKGIWKLLHYLSYLVMLFVFLHSLYLGTDLAKGIFRKIWILIGGILLLAVISRLWRTGTTRKAKP